MKPIAWVAVSGGLDSVVLLHFLKKNYGQVFRLQAIHVNHQLSLQADDFEQHCQKICQKLAVPLMTQRVNIFPKTSQNLEAKARRARYAIFEKILQESQLLFTAHHQDDQAETFLLRLLRGGGLQGVSAMQKVSCFHQAFLVRPLLSFSRETILQYATNHQLCWIDDISNQNINFDRNYLRHYILPVLKKRWPSVLATMTRFSAHCYTQNRLLTILTEKDFNSCQKTAYQQDCLDIPAIVAFNDVARQKNVLRFFIKKKQFIMPNEKILDQLLQLFDAKPDKLVRIFWQKTEYWRYQDKLFLLPAQKKRTATLTRKELAWCQQYLPQEIFHHMTIRFRQGGEKYISHHNQKRTLKNLFNQLKIPPWLRDRIPLAYYNDRLIALIGYQIFKYDKTLPKVITENNDIAIH